MAAGSSAGAAGAAGVAAHAATPRSIARAIKIANSFFMSLPPFIFALVARIKQLDALFIMRS
jgi:hypothetical protein